MIEQKRRSSDGFTMQQRKWIIARDGGKCQLCNGYELLQVHHIVPWRFAVRVYKWTLDRVNNPTNGITLCKPCHVGGTKSIHPDTMIANRAYRTNKNSYHEMFDKRDALCRQGRPYWNTKYDNLMAVLAIGNMINHVARGYFPTPWVRKEKKK